MELVEVADALYALPAGEFTAARDAAAKDAKAEDAEQSKAIKAFKRPTASAWLVNQLARQQPQRIGELLELGDELRAAQDALDGDDLRRLNRERHQLVHAVATEARALGDNVTEQVAREVESTLDVALADAGAGEAIRTGRLVRALASAGFEGVDLAGAVAVPEAPVPPRTKGSPRTPPPPKAAEPRQKTPPKPSAAEARATKAEQAKARRELTKARSEADAAERDLAEHDRTLDAARERIDAARRRLDELDAELKKARAERAAAEKHLETAQRDRNAAARARRSAEQRVDKLS